MPLFFDRDSDDAPPEVLEFQKRQQQTQLRNLTAREQAGDLNPNQVNQLKRLRAKGVVLLP
jgi:hypothetical protein